MSMKYVRNKFFYENIKATVCYSLMMEGCTFGFSGASIHTWFLLV